MQKNFLKILKIAAYTGLIAAGVFSILSGMKEKKKKDDKARMLLIARQIDEQIRNTNRKTSPRYHEKNQAKYDELWGNNESSCN